MAINKNIKWFAGGASTALIASVIYMNFFSPIGLATTTSGSERVSLIYAEKLMDDYTEFNNALKVKYESPTTKKDTIAVLQGFVFKAADIDTIIHFNNSKLGAPDKIIFYFGQTGSFTTGFWPFATNHPSLQIVAAGIQGTTLLNDNLGSAIGASLFDKADPCPPNCPKRNSFP